MNLKETIELVQVTAQKAMEVQIEPMPNNPEKALLFAGGVHTEIDTPYVAPPRQHTVQSVESFAAAFARWAGGDKANIWMDLGSWSLSFFTDEPLRRSSVTLKLTPSPQLLLLRTFEREVSRDQKTLVRMLRHDLAGCVDPGVLAAFRSIDFQKIATARGTIEHSKQSLDSDIVAQVTGDKKPEEFLVDAPLFAMKELDARTRIGITIDIDCAGSKFVLQAKPGHLELALDDARAAVLVKLENDLAAAGQENVTILAGSPN